MPRQLDTERLKRSFLGWLRSERDHCKMAAIPTLAQEDAKRPHRERETLVVEQTSIANRMKGIMARLGIRTFNPKLKKAPEHLQHVRTPEGEPIPTNTLAELYREMERLRLIREQILRIEKARLERLQHAPNTAPNLMILLLARVIGIGIERRTCSRRRSCHVTCATGEPWRAMRVSQVRPTRAERNAGRKGYWRAPPCTAHAPERTLHPAWAIMLCST